MENRLCPALVVGPKWPGGRWLSRGQDLAGSFSASAKGSRRAGEWGPASGQGEPGVPGQLSERPPGVLSSPSVPPTTGLDLLESQQQLPGERHQRGPGRMVWVGPRRPLCVQRAGTSDRRGFGCACVLPAKLGLAHRGRGSTDRGPWTVGRGRARGCSHALPRTALA